MDPDLFPRTLVRGVRIVPVGGIPAPEGLVDMRMRGGIVTEVAPRLAPRADEQILDGDGRWAIPGLWDHHVHLTQWAQSRARLDLAGARGPQEVCDRVRAHLAGMPAGAPGAGGTPAEALVVGFGHRSAGWARQPTVAELDAVSGGRPVVLVSGDGHNGWLNSAALRLFGLPSVQGALAENDWFPVWARLDSLPGVAQAAETAVDQAVAAAAALGVVGIVDLEFAAAYRQWPQRFARGLRGLRVRTGVYADGLDEVIAAGLRTGDDLAQTGGLLTMGPLKLITDGSLNTRSAWCHEPYADAAELEQPCGWPNVPRDELLELFGRARAAGLEVAAHAIGDAAIGQVLDCFARTGARGGIEHAQLVDWADLPRMAELGVSASVQPAHLLDDRDVAGACWPGREQRCYAFRSLLDAGVRVRLGSDAPVSPLDPWLAMAAAVWRSADERGPWHPEQALTPAEALAASTDGQPTLRVGSRADVVLLDADPLAGASAPQQAADRLRGMPVAATVLAGRVVHSAR